MCVCVWTPLVHEVRDSQSVPTAGLPSPTDLVFCRGVWHLHPTTLNEAVDASGKQDLISLVYLPSD